MAVFLSHWGAATQANAEHRTRCFVAATAGNKKQAEHVTKICPGSNLFSLPVLRPTGIFGFAV
jgi:hypothetical protein